MDASKYSRNMQLLCPTCGGSQFHHDETSDLDEQTVKCVQCNRETTKRALIDENSESINVHISEIREDIIKDIRTELSKTMKKIFK